MKKFNEVRFLHSKLQIYDNEFHVPSFPCPYPKLPPPFIVHSHLLKIVYLSTNPPLLL